MEIQLTLHGRKRKDAADCVGEAVNAAPVYLRAPTHNYDIGGIILDRNSVLTIGDCDEALPKVLIALQKAGFYTPEEEVPEAVPETAPEAQVPAEVDPEPVAVPEAVPEATAPPEGEQETPAPPEKAPAGPEEAPTEPVEDIPSEAEEALPEAETPEAQEAAPEEETLEAEETPPEEAPPDEAEAPPEPEEEPPSDSEQTDRVVIQMPLTGFPPEKIDNLRRLVASKERLIKKAIGIEALPIIEDSETLDFPWVPMGAQSDEIMAYAQLVSKLCDMAKTQQRVLATEQPVENEKYAFRCFLLRLGFIGEEYAAARKILLRNLEGNGSHKSGDGKPRPPKASPAAAPAGTAAIIASMPAVTSEAKTKFSIKKLFKGLKLFTVS